VDQGSDAGDQEHEQDRQRVDEQAELDGPAARGDPLVDGRVQVAGLGIEAEQRREQHQPDHEGGDHRGGGQEMAPPVGEPACQQQERRRREWDRDQQPDHQALARGGGERFEELHAYPSP